MEKDDETHEYCPEQVSHEGGNGSPGYSFHGVLEGCQMGRLSKRGQGRGSG